MGINRGKTPKYVWGESSVVDENLGSGDGVKVTFTGNLANTPVYRNSITITAGAAGVTDDGVGNLSGGGGSGTINYDTGAYSVTWNTAPATGTSVLADYSHAPYTIIPALPLDSVNAYTSPRPGSRVARGQSGIQDGWDTGWDYHLEGFQRWIEGADWDNKWVPMLQWARGKKVRFHPDKDSTTYVECYFHPQMELTPSPEDDGTRNLMVQLIHTSAFTGY